MQTFVITDTEKNLNNPNKQRSQSSNLFGLGLVSLIAACSSSSDGNSSSSDGNNSAPDGNNSAPAEGEPFEPTLPFRLNSYQQESNPLDPFTSREYSAGAVEIANGSDPSIFRARITYTDRFAIDDIAGAEFRQDNNHVNLYKFENDASSSSFNLVVAAPYDNRVVDDTMPSYQAGIVKIYWGLTPDSTSLNSVNSLTINGIKKSQIGNYAPEFFLLGTSSTEKYDMVIRSKYFTGSTVGNAGAIYILWDVADYSGSTKSINLGNLAEDTFNDTSGLLTIYGKDEHNGIGGINDRWNYKFLQISDGVNYDMMIATEWGHRNAARGASAIYILWDVADYSGSTKTINLGNLADDNVGAASGSLTIRNTKIAYYVTDKNIGHYAPEFLKISGKEGYDMLIRTPDARDLYNNTKGADPNSAREGAGAIYILWDVADYSRLTKTIDLANLADDNVGAASGSLAIHGSYEYEWLGGDPVNFLQIGGKDNEEKYDMVFETAYAGEIIDGTRVKSYIGAIYILWDVADYYSTDPAKKNKIIDLAAPDNITYGSLTVYGAKEKDKIGINAPEFLQIAGKAGEQKYDMVFSSGDVDKVGDGIDEIGEGAIYILWDVADYYNETEKHKIIELDVTSDDDNFATSGLLTIFGKNASSKLGESDKNIIYDTDTDGNKTLTSIDNGDTKDIAFKDEDYTYILFGDKVANDANGNNKVDSKTIDLAVIETAFTSDTDTNAGFFSYDFGGNPISILDDGNATITSTKEEGTTGYRFDNDDHDNLAAVQRDYTTDTSASGGNLSDADADLGVWDIA